MLSEMIGKLLFKNTQISINISHQRNKDKKIIKMNEIFKFLKVINNKKFHQTLKQEK